MNQFFLVLDAHRRFPTLWEEHVCLITVWERSSKKSQAVFVVLVLLSLVALKQKVYLTIRNDPCGVNE